MVKVKVFPFDKADEANKFAESVATKVDGGFSFSNGYLLVFYEDGQSLTINNKRAILMAEIKDRESKLFIQEANKAVQDSRIEKLKESIKAGDEEKEECKKNKEKFMHQQQYDTARGQLQAAQNVWLSTKAEIDRLSYEVDIYEEQLASLK